MSQKVSPPVVVFKSPHEMKKPYSLQEISPHSTNSETEESPEFMIHRSKSETIEDRGLNKENLARSFSTSSTIDAASQNHGSKDRKKQPPIISSGKTQEQLARERREEIFRQHTLATIKHRKSPPTVTSIVTSITSNVNSTINGTKGSTVSAGQPNAEKASTVKSDIFQTFRR